MEIDIHPTYKQDLAWELLRDNEIEYILFGGAANGGKQIALDSIIPTPDGYKKMSDIHTGDYVLSNNGFSTKVVSESVIDYKPDSYEITFDTGEKIKADANHLWKTFSEKERTELLRHTESFRKERKSKRRSRAKENPINSWSQKSITLLNQNRKYNYLPISQGKIRTTKELFETQRTKRERINYTILNTNPLQFPRKDLEIEPYLLGLWLGDGYSTDNVIGMLTTDLNEIIGNIKDIEFSERKKRNDIFSAYAIKGLTQSLRKIKVFDNKHIPVHYLRSSFSQRLDLLQGLMDTDGHCDRNGQCEIALSNEELAVNVHELICSLGIKASIRTRKLSMINSNHKDSHRIKFVSSLPVFKLKRKLVRQNLNPSMKTKHRSIVSIRKCDPVPMKCIQVENRDGMYLVGKSFIPTHNSWLGCSWLVIFCYLYPGTKYFIGREELKRLRDSTLLTFFKVLRYYKIPDGDFTYNGQDHYILHKNGSRIDLLDLKYLPSDPLYERYGSVEYTSGWIEEAGEVHFGAFDVLKSRVGRHMNDKYNLLGKLLLTCNPKKNWLYQFFYRPFKTKTIEKPFAFIPSLVTDNNFRESGSVEKLESITNKAQRERLLNGNWDYEDEPDQLIMYEWLDKAQSVKIVTGKKALGCDVARYGDDSSVIMEFNGNSHVNFKRYRELSTDKFADKIREYAKEKTIDANMIGVDGCGLGAGTVDMLKRFGSNVKDINSGEKPVPIKNDEGYTFNNLRSQMWWYCREELRKGEINIQVVNEELFEDLTAPKYEVGQDNKIIKVESKKTIKERIGRSPDLGDAFVYANWMRKDRTKGFYRKWGEAV
jgi:hypothetical protein